MSSTRRSQCHCTAWASARHSASRPTATSSSGPGSGAWTRWTGQPSTTDAGTTTCRGEFGERYGVRLNAAVAQRVEDPMGCRSGWRTPHYAGSPLHNPFAFDGRQQAPLGQHRAGVRCTAWMQRAGVARTARTTVGQASSSWSARCSRILLSYRMITPMTAAISAARNHIATSPALPAAARPATVLPAT